MVDDDPQTLRYVRNALSGAGYEPVVTADPDEVLRLMDEHRPQLVLMDMMLPGSDGIELMREIFGIAEVPVVFLSAYGRDQVVARAFDMGPPTTSSNPSRPPSFWPASGLFCEGVMIPTGPPRRNRTSSAILLSTTRSALSVLPDIRCS